MFSAKKLAITGLVAGALLAVPTAAMAAPTTGEVQAPPAAVGAADPTVYGVHLDEVGVVFASSPNTKLHGSARGYSAGNWVNVWVREQGTTKWKDLGGAIVDNPADFTIEKRLPTDGGKNYEVQISMGSYPDESYSEIHRYITNYM